MKHSFRFLAAVCYLLCHCGSSRDSEEKEHLYHEMSAPCLKTRTKLQVSDLFLGQQSI